MTQATLHSEISSRLSYVDVVTQVHLRDSPQELALTLLSDRPPARRRLQGPRDRESLASADRDNRPLGV